MSVGEGGAPWIGPASSWRAPWISWGWAGRRESLRACAWYATSSQRHLQPPQHQGQGRGLGREEREGERERGEKERNVRIKNENGGVIPILIPVKKFVSVLHYYYYAFSIAFFFSALSENNTLSESYRSSTCRVSHGTELLCARVCRKAPSCGWSSVSEGRRSSPTPAAPPHCWWSISQRERERERERGVWTYMYMYNVMQCLLRILLNREQISSAKFKGGGLYQDSYMYTRVSD